MDQCLIGILAWILYNKYHCLIERTSISVKALNSINSLQRMRLREDTWRVFESFGWNGIFVRLSWPLPNWRRQSCPANPPWNLILNSRMLTGFGNSSNINCGEPYSREGEACAISYELYSCMTSYNIKSCLIVTITNMIRIPACVIVIIKHVSLAKLLCVPVECWANPIRWWVCFPHQWV